MGMDLVSYIKGRTVVQLVSKQSAEENSLFSRRGNERTLHNEGLHNLYSARGGMRGINSSRMRFASM
jgi:hypothetical protein